MYDMLLWLIMVYYLVFRLVLLRGAVFGVLCWYVRVARDVVERRSLYYEWYVVVASLCFVGCIPVGWMWFGWITFSYCCIVLLLLLCVSYVMRHVGVC